RLRSVRLLASLATLAIAAVACPHREPARPALRVGTSGDYAPFSFRRDGEFVGLDVDVARRFARDSRRALVIVPFRWPDLVDDLRAGRFEVAMGGVTV